MSLVFICIAFIIKYSIYCLFFYFELRLSDNHKFKNVIRIKGICMIQDSAPRQISVAEMAPHVHSFKIGENKVDKISSWLITWIKMNLDSRRIKPYDKLPPKSDLAFHTGVSVGTIQNVYRFVEDEGLIESKQRLGTYIKNPNVNPKFEKLTSKREKAVEIIKKHIIEYNYKCGVCLNSTRKLAELTGMSTATVRIAIRTLLSDGILEKVGNTFVIKNLDYKIENIQTQTLVNKISLTLKEYIADNFSEGDKLPTNLELAKKLNVSVKTIHDAIKELSEQGILLTRRGQYGTTVENCNYKNKLYQYEEIELKIKHFIAEKCEIGVKLPSIEEFSEFFSVSPKTIKKALDNLAEDGYLRFKRGRYGGTFVTDIPQGVNEAYKWLAISSDYVSNT